MFVFARIFDRKIRDFSLAGNADNAIFSNINKYHICRIAGPLYSLCEVANIWNCFRIVFALCSISIIMVLETRLSSAWHCPCKNCIFYIYFLCLEIPKFCAWGILFLVFLFAFFLLYIHISQLYCPRQLIILQLTKLFFQLFTRNWPRSLNR